MLFDHDRNPENVRHAAACSWALSDGKEVVPGVDRHLDIITIVVGFPVRVTMLVYLRRCVQFGVASVYAVGVVPAARGKGIGGTITLKPLLEARHEGSRYGVLFSTEMGQSVYERIGFHPTGTRTNRYLWRNASAATT